MIAPVINGRINAYANFPTNHPLYLGMGRYKPLDGADLVLDIDDPLLGGDVVAHVPSEHRDLGLLLECFGGVVVAAIVGGDIIARILQSLGDGGADAARTPRD